MKPDKAIELALDAHSMGDDESAARQHGLSDRTIRRAKKQVSEDPVLAAIVHDKKREMAERLHDKRVEVIELMLDGMKGRLPSMEDRDFVGAYKIVTDSHEVALRILNADKPLGAHREQSESNQPAASEGRGEDAVASRWLGPLPTERTQ